MGNALLNGFIGMFRDRSRKKAAGHGKSGGESSWKHRYYSDDGKWNESREQRLGREERRSRVDAEEALNEVRAAIMDQQMMEVFSQPLTSASYGEHGRLTTCFNADGMKVVIAVQNDTARLVKVSSATPRSIGTYNAKPANKRRHRGGRKHRRQRLLAAAA